MKKSNARFVVLLLLVSIGGCANITVEVRSAPYLDKWDGNVDLEIYHPDDIPSAIDMGDYTFDILLNNYSTLYRGMKVLGVEAYRGPDTKLHGNEFALLLGIRPHKNQPIESFFPNKIELIIGQINRVSLRPKDVYFTNQSVACFYARDEYGWGAKAKK